MSCSGVTFKPNVTFGRYTAVFLSFISFPGEAQFLRIKTAVAVHKTQIGSPPS